MPPWVLRPGGALLWSLLLLFTFRPIFGNADAPRGEGGLAGWRTWPLFHGSGRRLPSQTGPPRAARDPPPAVGSSHAALERSALGETRAWSQRETWGGVRTRQEVTRGRFARGDDRIRRGFTARPEPCHPGACRGCGERTEGLHQGSARPRTGGRAEETTRNAGKDENACCPRELRRQEGVKQKGQGEKQESAERELLCAEAEKIWGVKSDQKHQNAAGEAFPAQAAPTPSKVLVKSTWEETAQSWFSSQRAGEAAERVLGPAGGTCPTHGYLTSPSWRKS